jgi:5-methylthioadenosine/S-adenosylhomocysteine deaminase
MVTRYYNAKIYSEGKIIEGEIIVYNNLIAHIGEPVMGTMADNEVDLKGKYVFPSFKNSHSHSPMTFLRNAADDMPLGDWLNTQIFPKEAVLREDECYWFTKLAIMEYLRGGITMASDMYFMLDPIAQACTESGFRNVLCYGANDAVLKGKSPAKIYDYGFSQLKGNFIRYRVGIHAEYTCSEKLLREISEYVNDRGEPVYVHMSETKAEVEACKARYGKTPVQLFRDLGLFNAGGVVYHMVHPEGDDLDILKEMNVGVVTCPASNMKLASGIAPVKEMLDKAEKDANLKRDEIINQAREEAKRRMDNLKVELEQERSSMEKEIRQEIVEVAFAAAEKIVSKEINQEKYISIVDDILKGANE